MRQIDEPGKIIFAAVNASTPLRWEDITPFDAQELLGVLGDPIKTPMRQHLKIPPQDQYHLENLRAHLQHIIGGSHPPLVGYVADQVVPLQQSDSTTITFLAERFLETCRALNERKAGLGAGSILICPS